MDRIAFSHRQPGPKQDIELARISQEVKGDQSKAPPGPFRGRPNL
jgi:hypothetical protein